MATTGNDTRMTALREAYRASAAEDNPVETPIEEPAVEAEPAPEPVAQPEPAPEGETPEEKAERTRDEAGRFAKAEKEKPAGKVEPPKPGAKAEAAAPKPGGKAETAAPAKGAPAAAPAKPEAAPAKHPGDDLKAPQSWTATAREEWAKVPPVARQEIHRLEGETRKVLGENAQLRSVTKEAVQFRQAISQGFAPYEGIARAAGAPNAFAYAETALQTAATLQAGTPQQRAQVLANLIAQFSDVEAINAVLQAGGAQPASAPGPRQPAPQQSQDIDALLEQKLGAMAEKAEAGRADQELQAFMASPPEFVRDVWTDMQLLLDAAEGSGRKLTYPQAYDRACKMNEDVAAVLARRAEVAAVASPPSASPAQRARAATATVRSRPTGGVGGPSADATDRRAMLGRVMEKARG